MSHAVAGRYCTFRTLWLPCQKHRMRSGVTGTQGHATKRSVTQHLSPPCPLYSEVVPCVTCCNDRRETCEQS